MTRSLLILPLILVACSGDDGGSDPSGTTSPVDDVADGTYDILYAAWPFIGIDQRTDEQRARYRERQRQVEKAAAEGRQHLGTE